MTSEIKTSQKNEIRKNKIFSDMNEFDVNPNRRCHKFIIETKNIEPHCIKYMLNVCKNTVYFIIKLRR